MDLAVLFGIVILLVIIKIVVKSIKLFVGAALTLILLAFGMSFLNKQLGTDITIMGSLNAALKAFNPSSAI